MAIDNLLRLGVGLAKVQERFERDEMPFLAHLVITADGGILVEARFMLADISYPIAWDAESGFEIVDRVVAQMFDFAEDPRNLSDILDAKVDELHSFLEKVREENPEIVKLHKDLEAARAEFDGVVGREEKRDTAPISRRQRNTTEYLQ